MRPMRWTSIAVFSAVLAPVLALAVATAWRVGRQIPALGEFRSVAVSAAAIFLFYAYAMVAHRLLLSIAPMGEGRIVEGSGQEFRYQVYILFYLFLLNPLIRCQAIPIPIMRLVYLALGARLGPNTYVAGIIFDPLFVTIGANTLVGEAALLVPHVIEGKTVSHYRISIGSNVTIGAHAIVLAGVTIGDNVIVAANSVVTKSTRIRSGETWGGTPARRLSTATLSVSQLTVG
jgi:acetyltransferase-like isoleucine patch superfamily enzyme